MTNTNPPRLYSSAEIAEEYGFTTTRVHQLAKHRGITPHQIAGKAWLFTAEQKAALRPKTRATSDLQ